MIEDEPALQLGVHRLEKAQQLFFVQQFDLQGHGAYIERKIPATLRRPFRMWAGLQSDKFASIHLSLSGSIPTHKIVLRGRGHYSRHSYSC